MTREQLGWFPTKEKAEEAIRKTHEIEDQYGYPRSHIWVEPCFVGFATVKERKWQDQVDPRVVNINGEDVVARTVVDEY